jgi:hypothetical protein
LYGITCGDIVDAETTDGEENPPENEFGTA